MVVAGIMTGTSVDAIDIAICDIQRKGDRDTVSLRSFLTRPFHPETHAAIMDALAGASTMEALCDLPYLLASDMASCLIPELAPHSVEAIAVHGQTLWHHPPVSTWQAMSGPALAAHTGLPVVHDFRSADIALGGQGAPLVPVFDHATLTRPDATVVALNIGGMANVTILPPNAGIDDVRAFDCGPGNVWIDAAARATFGKRYDEGGAIARAGRVIRPMLEECFAMPYFAAEPPKSTGRELFTLDEAKRLITKYSHPSAPLEDAVATMTEVTAWSIADHCKRYAPDARNVVVSGGGARNLFLLERLQDHLGSDVSVTVHAHADEKEAMAFAYLGWLTLNGRPGNVLGATGAARRAVLGSVARA
jgi:anhydro-N-acetylmuramic acid kinase